MSTPNPVTTLAKEWLSVDGVKQDRTAYGFIGKLYKTYGEETVLAAIDLVRTRPTQAEGLSRPNEYLRGVCRKIGVSGAAINQEGREKLTDMMKDMFA